jgi:uncharacterized protein (DUF2267 family)
MTLPFEYQNPSLEFERFMLDARDLAELATTNMAWNMVVGVLHTFRRRLDAPQVLAFASVLPPVVRALFIEGWQRDAPVATFGSREDLLAEVRSVRAAHNFSPPNAIEAVAEAVRRHVDVRALEAVLATLPEGAQSFWAGPAR